MIKCMECGVELNRIQWTHLRNKCTGKFSNVRQYMAAYPDAPIVDSELSKRSAITEQNFINKYGNIDGIVRWNEYRNKQSHSNSFEYKREKFGWTREKFDEFNSSRSITLKKCIERYGEEEGIKRWEHYCERQSYTNTKEYFVEKYGEIDGLNRYLDVNRRKNIYDPVVMSERMGIEVDQAKEIIINRLVKSDKIYGSDLEREFTNLLEESFGKLDYITYRNPYGKWSHLLNKFVLFDIKHGNCVIEFNGDYWHANPKIYRDDAIIRGRTSVEIQEHDRKKIQTAIDCGFRVYVVWENEFKSNKLETIQRVIEWMQNGPK